MDMEEGFGTADRLPSEMSAKFLFYEGADFS